MTAETELVDRENAKDEENTNDEEQQEQEQETTTTTEQKLENDPIIVKAKSLELPELFDFIKDLDNQYTNYITGIKSILIRIAAEKLEERGMTAVSNIVDEIAEKLAGSKIPISIVYIRKCIPDHLKKITKTRTGNNNNKQQTEQEFKTDEEIEKEHINQSSTIPQIETENDLQIPVNRELPQQLQTIESELQERLERAEEKIRLLEKSLKAKDGEIPYIESIETIRVIKWDKSKINEIDAAWKNSLKEVVFYIDIRTSKLVSIITDKQHKKITKH